MKKCGNPSGKSNREIEREKSATPFFCSKFNNNIWLQYIAKDMNRQHFSIGKKITSAWLEAFYIYCTIRQLRSDKARCNAGGKDLESGFGLQLETASGRKCAQPKEAEKEHEGRHGPGRASSASELQSNMRITIALGFNVSTEIVYKSKSWTSPRQMTTKWRCECGSLVPQHAPDEISQLLGIIRTWTWGIETCRNCYLLSAFLNCFDWLHFSSHFSS